LTRGRADARRRACAWRELHDLRTPSRVIGEKIAGDEVESIVSLTGDHRSGDAPDRWRRRPAQSLETDVKSEHATPLFKTGWAPSDELGFFGRWTRAILATTSASSKNEGKLANIDCLQGGKSAHLPVGRAFAAHPWTAH
jgi:hypothetical protein